MNIVLTSKSQSHWWNYRHVYGLLQFPIELLAREKCTPAYKHDLMLDYKNIRTQLHPCIKTNYIKCLYVSRQYCQLIRGRHLVA